MKKKENVAINRKMEIDKNIVGQRQIERWR